MLARSAQCVYWMGRYLERAEHLSRLLELHTRSLVDRPLQEIHMGWQLIYAHLGLPLRFSKPNENSSEAPFELAHSEQLVDDLAFSRELYSVKSCFRAGRENARQTRHATTAEMWSCLNLSYLSQQEASIEKIWESAPEHYFAQVAREVDMFNGVADATMYRNEGYDFLQLGRSIEHVQLMSALLSTHTDERYTPNSRRLRDVQLESLLDTYQADEIYQHYHGINTRVDLVMNLLVTDRQLPVSLRYHTERIHNLIEGLEDAPDLKLGGMAERSSGRLLSQIQYEWPDTEDRHRMLTEIMSTSEKLHDLISNAWFDYQVFTS